MSNYSSAHEFDQRQNHRHEEIDAYLSESSTYNSFNSGFAHHIQKKNASPQQLYKQDSGVNFNQSIDLNFQFSQQNDRFLGNWKTDHYEISRSYVNANKEINISLYMTTLEPIGQKIHSQILIVHGFGEHQGKYFNVADTFAKKGMKVILYDQRGFGRSGGMRGTSTIEEMHQDLETILLQQDRQLPVFIYCHALGAAIVLSFCIVNPHINFNGIITTNAYLRLNSRKYNLPKKMLLRLLNLLVPNLQINHYIDFSHQSKNNYQIKKSVEDNLVQNFLTISMAYNVMKLCDFILPNSSNFNIPILLIHGKQDRVSSHINSLDFYRLTSSKEKSIKIFEYGFHELHNDSEGGRMAKIILSWCQKLVDSDKRISFIRNINYGIEAFSSQRRLTNQKMSLLLIILALILLKKYIIKFPNINRNSNCLKYLSTYWIKFLSKCFVKLFM